MLKMLADLTLRIAGRMRGDALRTSNLENA